MRIRGRSSYGLTWGFALIGALSASMLFAGGPLTFDTAGNPVGWNNASPVGYKTDLGFLGTLDNTQATQLVADTFAIWQGVATAAITYQRVGPLGEDVHGPTLSPAGPGNYGPYLGPFGGGTTPRGESVVVFDADGSIFDDLYGVGTSIIGFGGPTFFSDGTTTVAVGSAVPPGAHILEGLVFLNGKFIDGVSGTNNPEISATLFQAALLHELGHFSGLDHTQLHPLAGFSTADGATVGDISRTETMYPLIGVPEQATLELDDRVALSRLYPQPSFASAPGCLSGQVFAPDGSPWNDANVVAYSRTALAESVSAVSGAGLAPAQAGRFSLCGLTPGHSYQLEVQEIDAFSSGGSSVGPFDVPLPLPGPPEGWNGLAESSDPALDDPSQALLIPAVAGDKTGFNVRLGEQMFAVKNLDWLDDAAPPGLADNAPTGMVLGDFDEDGKADLVSVQLGSFPGNELRFSRGRGDGTFDAPVKIDSFFGNLALVAGQFNPSVDAHLDLAVVSTQGELRLYLGDGHGGFAVPSSPLIPSTCTPQRPCSVLLAAGRLDGNATDDLIYLRSEFDGSVTTIALLADGSGGFNGVTTIIPATACASFGDSTGIVLGQFLSSADTDAIFPQPGQPCPVGPPGPPGLVALVGNGAGGFTVYKQDLSVISGRLGTAIAAADFDRDGRLDLAVPDYAPVGQSTSIDSSSIDLLHFDATSGGFSLSARYAVPEALQTAIIAGDFDRDGLVDVVSAGSTLAPGRPGAKLTLALGDGAGGIRSVPGPLGSRQTTSIWGLAEFPAALYPGELRAADLNGDGRLDLVVSDHSTGVFGVSFPARISVLVAQDLPSNRARDFFTVSPCRVFDSRGSVALFSPGEKTLQISGACGIPPTAKAVSANITAIGPSGDGELLFYPGPLGPVPNASSISFRAGVTRANNGMLALSPDGSGRLTVKIFVADNGSLDLAIDVNGYFQ